MEFSALPEELIFKVFSYLLHSSLLAASQVSQTWKKVAFDPLLWTEITIDASIESLTMHVGGILRHATMLRKLDISRSSVNLEEVASVTPFRHLNELAIHSNMLSHPAVPQILQHCESLTSLVLRGRCALSEANIPVLENLPDLKSLDVSEEVRMCDEIIRRICSSCPHLEELKVNTKSVRVAGVWRSFLCLKRLSVTTTLTPSLLSCSRYCPNVESLEIEDVVSVNGIRVSQALQGFPKLKSVTVSGFPGTGWFSPKFLPPMPLEYIDAPRLAIKKVQLDFLKQSCRESIRNVSFHACPDECFELRALSSFNNLESICISGLSGSDIVFSELCTFRNLVRAKLVVEGEITRAVEQLASIVDIHDTSKWGGTRLAMNLTCASEAAQDDIVQAVRHFKEFLSQSTRLCESHLRRLEEHCSRSRNVSWTALNTSFPVRSLTLKYLVLDLIGDMKK